MKIFNDILNQLAHERIERQIINKDSYFSRKPRKLSLKDLIKIIMSMESGPIKGELLKYYDYDIETISSPGFVEAREKLNIKAFVDLLEMVNERFCADEKYKNLRLIAMDGSDSLIPTNSNDYDTHNPGRRFNSDGFKCLHINATYDILNKRYIDVLIQGVRSHAYYDKF